MKLVIIVWVFFAIITAHFFYVTREISTKEKNGKWAAYAFEKSEESRLNRYVAPGEYWLGLSYALAGSFAVFCLLSFIRKQKLAAIEGAAGGIALGGLLWASGCFLIGCCGSPMLPVYIGLLGPKFLGVTKPLTFFVTIASTIIGYRIIIKRNGSCFVQENQEDVNSSLHEDSGGKS